MKCLTYMQTPRFGSDNKGLKLNSLPLQWKHNIEPQLLPSTCSSREYDPHNTVSLVTDDCEGTNNFYMPARDSLDHTFQKHGGRTTSPRYFIAFSLQHPSNHLKHARNPSNINPELYNVFHLILCIYLVVCFICVSGNTFVGNIIKS